MESQIYSENDLENYIQMLRLMKRPFKAKTDGIFPQRSNAHNGYMHLIIKMYADHKGHSLNKMKEQLQLRHALLEEKVIDEKVIYIVESTAGMNSLRMMKFCEDICKEAWDECELYLPAPNETFEITENEFKQKIIT
jgi:hypothetical protein